MQTDLARDLINECRLKDIKLLAAESCTGGLLSANLTSVSGCSDIFLHSIVCYSNQSKIELLNVNKITLNTWGAVSKQTVGEMLIGLKDQSSKKSFGIAISGVAGPQDSENKPVGKVFIGIIGSFCDLFLIKEFNFGNSERTIIQRKTVKEAFLLCLHHTRLIN